MTLDIPESYQEAVALGASKYHGRVCQRCKTTIKRTRQRDCVYCHNARNRAYFQTNPDAVDKLKERNRTERARALKKQHKRLYKANLKQARVAWADQDKINDIYVKARALGMDVDHIVPLKGKLVCGLHVESNLQLLTPQENNKKRNSFDPWTFT
uniref:HNH endonuclease n=1 Tax=Ralstonia phage BOESR1 TaxID=3034917 RepID=A0AA49EQA3_9CAUD|nr:hypothetical protein HIBIKMCM_00005 [Ralstonia phage BOESR1]